MNTIEYPFLPEGRSIKYVPLSNPYMCLAKAYARAQSLDKTMPGGAVVVDKNNRVIGFGANGSTYHERHECERVKQKCKSGEGYELCEGCSPINHSERRAVNSARANLGDTNKASLYLWGHWWVCKDCWECIIEYGIQDVYLMEGSNVLFNKENPSNIVGRQFESPEHIL